ncbi:hypothetical protein TNCV_357461 [Trichonephila clavipes]|nr:hypothetical protein TNCV_357461 [Trichonephila clavipes]
MGFLGRRLAARTLPPVTIRELRLALQDEWAAMPQQLIDTLILSMGRRCETCLASSTIKKRAASLIFSPSESTLLNSRAVSTTRLLPPLTGGPQILHAAPPRSHSHFPGEVENGPVPSDLRRDKDWLRQGGNTKDYVSSVESRDKQASVCQEVSKGVMTINPFSETVRMCYASDKSSWSLNMGLTDSLGHFKAWDQGLGLDRILVLFSTQSCSPDIRITLAEWLVHLASASQVRGLNPELGKVDSAFIPSMGR